MIKKGLLNISKEKYFALRYIFFISILFSAGIILSAVFTEYYFLFYFLLSLFIVFILVSIIYRNLKMVLILFLCLFSFILGFGRFQIAKSNINKYDIGYRECRINGKINENIEINNKYIYGYLEDIILINSDNEKEYLKCSAYISQPISVELISKANIGDRIEFNGKIYFDTPYKNGINIFRLNNNSYLTIHKIEGNINIIKGNISIAEKIRQYISTYFESYLDYNTSQVAKGMLLGMDKNIDDNLMEQYRQSGIAHIYSVSGLHIGFLLFILSQTIGRIFQRNKWISSAISIIVIFIYIYICGFPVSAMRAGIMAIIYLILRPQYKVDMITCISIAMLLLLVINPAFIFDGGFQLSFSAVFGIALITNKCMVFLIRYVKHPIIFKILQGLSINFGASIGTLPFILIYYGQFSIITIFINFIAVPLLTIAFILAAFSLIPHMYFLLIPFRIIINFVNSLIGYISTLNYTFVEFNYSGVCFGLWIILILVISGNINLKLKKKTIACIFLIICILICNIFVSVQNKPIMDAIHIEKNIFVYENSQGNMIIVSELKTRSHCNKIEKYLSAYKKYDIYVYFYDTDINEYYFEYLAVNYKFNIIIFSDLDSKKIDACIEENNIFVLQEYASNQINFKCISDIGVLKIQHKNFNIWILDNKTINLYADIKLNEYGIKSNDIIFSMYNTNLFGMNYRNFTMDYNQAQNVNSYVFLGDFTYDLNYDRIIKNSYL